MKIRLIILFTFFLLKIYSQVGSDSLLNSPLPDSLKLNKSLISDQLKLNIDTPKISREIIDSKLNQSKETIGNSKDSLLAKSKGEIKSAKPKAINFIKQQAKSLKPLGSISLGYDYGVLPYVVGNSYPASGFRTEGTVSILLLGLPIEVMFYYTNAKNIVGLNNYFRVSYDANRYRDMLGQKMSGQEKEMRNKFNNLQLQQQQMQQKMEFLGLAKQNLTNQYQYPSLNNSIPTNSPAAFQLDSSSIPNQNQYNQYTNVDTNAVMDSIGKFNTYSGKMDSLQNEYAGYKQKYDSINKLVIDTKSKIEQIQNLNNNNPSSLYNPYLSKYQNILKTIKKFEIGLCSPNYSTFLINNIPLQGINIELEKNNNFFGITYGTTINNLLFNTNTLQGSIQGARNLYNYFDFGNLSAGRKILAIKGGFGSKENSHIHIGALVGKGRTDYLSPIPDGTTNTSSIESNLVLEIDGKYKFSEKLSFDLIYGKSSVKEGDLTSEQLGKAVNELFSGFRSNAALIRTTVNIKKTGTKVTATTRWIDPFFKSFGLGFIRSDNMRYELKIDQQIGKKIKYTLAFRREEDNILQLYDYKNVFYSINNSLSYKINRQLTVRLIYVPLFRELRTGETTIKDQNNISTIIASYTPRAKKMIAQFNALYSRYLITGDSTNINFENITYTQQLQFKSGFSTGLNVSWFKNSLNDSLNNDTYLGVADVGYKTKKNHSITLGGKAAYKIGTAMQYGFLVRTNIHLIKGLYWEAQAEKILIGDYYNSFINSHIEEFPYYLSTKLTLQF